MILAIWDISSPRCLAIVTRKAYLFGVDTIVTRKAYLFGVDIFEVRSSSR